MASNSVSYRNNVAVDAVAITLADGTDITTKPCGGFLVGTAGTLRVTPSETADGTYVDLVGLQAGQIVPLRVKRFWSTGSTAGSIVAFY